MLPTFLRETRTTVERLERFARDTDPLVRDLRGPADDLGPTLEDLAELSPDLERLFRAVGPLAAASRNGVPAAERLLEGIQPVLESAHVFLPELNPILSYLSFAREQVATFLAPGGSALGGNGIGGYRSSRFAEHYLPQSAIIDSRSLQRRASRPFWERANSIRGAERLGALHRARRDRGLRLRAGGRRGAEPERLGRHLGAALLRGPAAALPGPALPAACAAGGGALVHAPEGRAGNSPARP